jgi:hypothetical protein
VPLVAAFRVWLADEGGTFEGVVGVTPADLPAIETVDQEAGRVADQVPRPPVCPFLKRILEQDFPPLRVSPSGKRYGAIDISVLIAKYENASPGKIRRALDEGVRRGLLEHVKSHGGYPDKWRRLEDAGQ